MVLSGESELVTHADATPTAESTSLTRLLPLLRPRTVAVVGASDRTDHAARMARNLINSTGLEATYFVNPTRDELFGSPCHNSLADLPTVPDLAAFLVGRDRVLGAVSEAVDVGVRSAIVIAEGFGENSTGPGKQLQQELGELCRRSGLVLCGPNCAGIINVHANVAPYSAPMETPLRPGGVGVISQSGSNTQAIMTGAHERAFGLSYLISSGNESVVTLEAYMEVLVDDVNTTSLCLYIEELRDPARFFGAARRAIERGKPVIALMVGRSPEGAEAVRAHTGAIAQSNRYLRSLFADAGILVADNLEELLDKCTIFGQLSTERWPVDERTGVFAIGGGSASLVADQFNFGGLRIAKVDGTSIRAEQGPDGLSIQDPLELPGVHLRGAAAQVPSMYFRELARSGRCGSFLGVGRPGTVLKHLAGESGRLPSDVTIPLTLCYPVTRELQPAEREMISGDIAVVAGLERCTRALGAAVDFGRYRKGVLDGTGDRRFESEGVVCREGQVLAAPRFLMAGFDLSTPGSEFEFVKSYGLPVARYRVVHDAGEAGTAADALGYPVTVKLVARDIIHKRRAKGLKLGLASREAVEQAAASLLEQGARVSAHPCSLLVQEMAIGAFELYCGLNNEDERVPAIIVGLGGSLVELQYDLAVAQLPIDVGSAGRLLKRLRCYDAVFSDHGMLGGEGRHQAEKLLFAVSELGHDMRDAIQTMDLNPVIMGVDGRGSVIVDVKVFHSSTAAADGESPFEKEVQCRTQIR